MILLAANREVAVERLIQAIWDESPPITAREQIQICVCMLRKRFTRVGVPASIVTCPSGYSLQVDPGDLDLLVFEDLVSSARRAVDDGMPQKAERDYRKAVSMWPSGGNLPGGSQILDSVAATLTEKRLTTIEEWGATCLSVGRTDGLVSLLMELVAEYPLRERLRAQLMDALHRCGRRAEALETYRAGREVLVRELGIEPGEELRQLQQRILVDTPRRLEPVPRLVPVPDAQPPESLPGRRLLQPARRDSVPSSDRAMSRTLLLSTEDKMRIVLRVLACDLTVGEAAGTYRQTEQAIERWRRQFLDGGRAGLTEPVDPVSSHRERELLARVAELASALGEAHVELRTWKHKAQTQDDHLMFAT